jgi:predicted transcriptional regulator
MIHMTKKLEDAITKVRQLPEDDQDMAADVLLSMIAEPAPLDDEARSAIREGLDQARRGEFVPDEEIQALWKRHGL